MRTPASSRDDTSPRGLWRALIRHAYLAFMLLGLNGLGVWLISAGHPRWLLGLLLGAAIGASFLAERAIPYEPGWNEPHDDVGRDWWHFAVNEVSYLASVGALPLLVALSPWRGWWPNHWPLALQLVVAVLVLDLGVTVTHWASHRMPLLWRFHAVHHSVKRHYGFNGLMKHPLHQALEMTVGAAPLVVLGLPEHVAVLLALATAIQLLLQHSNADYTTGPLSKILALNKGHRFHHLKWPGVGDVNFGLFTNVGDYLLGTWSFDPQRRFTSDDLGIGKEPNYPTGYWEQLKAPFRRR